MLAVTVFDPRTRKFGVFDTDDGSLEYVDGAVLIKAVFEYGITIKGVTNKGVTLCTDLSE